LWSWPFTVFTVFTSAAEAELEAETEGATSTLSSVLWGIAASDDDGDDDDDAGSCAPGMGSVERAEGVVVSAGVVVATEGEVVVMMGTDMGK
jgi:hypothetical protein